jgi:hypothetical protein
VHSGRWPLVGWPDAAWVMQGQAACTDWLGLARRFGPVASNSKKFLFLFPGLFELFQTLKIRNSLFRAPKIMNLVPLNL